MDLLLDTSTHDLIFINGETPVTMGRVENVAQRVKIKLLSFKGEWFYDTVYGIPYMQEILGKKVPKSKVDRILQQGILEEEGVSEITHFSSTLVGRKYSLKVIVRSTDNNLIDIEVDDIGV